MKFRTDAVELHPESYMAKFPWMAVTLAPYDRFGYLSEFGGIPR